MAAKPEELARERIDDALFEAGWLVQDVDALNSSAGIGIAVGELPLVFHGHGRPLWFTTSPRRCRRGDNYPDTGGNRRNRVELHVSNIKVAHRRLAESWRQMQPIIESSWGEPSFHVLDPDGNLVELIKKRPSKESAWRL